MARFRILFVCTIILYINYIANYVCGKFTDSMVAKNYEQIIYFLWFCIFCWILSPIFCNLRDYLIKMNELQNQDNQFRLKARFCESFASVIVFCFVLFKICGFSILLLTFLYSFFTQIIEYFLLIKLDKSKEKYDYNTIYFKFEKPVLIIKDIFQNLKGYVPYFILIVPYLQDLITLGDTTKSIVAFKYVARGLSFFVDNRKQIKIKK